MPYVEHSGRAGIILQNQKESAEQSLKERKFILSSREGKSEGVRNGTAGKINVFKPRLG